MVCYDIHCFICGNISSKFELEKSIIEDIKDSKLLDKLKIFSKDTEWLNNLTLLTSTDNIIHNIKNGNNCVTFFDINNNEYFHNTYLNLYNKTKSLNLNTGFFLHTDCWNYIKLKYNIELKYSNLPFKFLPYDTIHDYFLFIKYDIIYKYFDQSYFDFVQIYNDNNSYICYSPLKNKKNASRINKIISKLKLKNNLKRKSPNVSATFYKNNDIKIGNDNNMWIIKNKKWYLLDDNILEINISYNKKKDYKNKLYNLLLSIPKKAEYNTLPIFINNVIYQKNKYNISILYTDKTKYIIDKINNILK